MLPNTFVRSILYQKYFHQSQEYIKDIYILLFLGNTFKNFVHVDQFTFHISLLSLKFSIFIHLSLLKMTSTVLSLHVAECRTPVTYELSYMTLLSMSSHSSVNIVKCSPCIQEFMGSIPACWGVRFSLLSMLASF